MVKRSKNLVDADGNLVRKIITIKSPSGPDHYLYLPRNFVPIVVKNREWLTGFLTGVHSTKPEGAIIKFNLHSLRFIDIMVEGTRLSTLTPEYVKNMLELKAKEIGDAPTHPDNQCKQSPSLLILNCPCGNHYQFKKDDDIPEESTFCGLCGKLILDYHNVDEARILTNNNPKITIDTSESEIKKNVMVK